MSLEELIIVQLIFYSASTVSLFISRTLGIGLWLIPPELGPKQHNARASSNSTPQTPTRQTPGAYSYWEPSPSVLAADGFDVFISFCWAAGGASVVAPFQV